jgi:D-alanyl-D-alanine carboxypeptidase
MVATLCLAGTSSRAEVGASIVVDDKTGNVIFAERADVPRAPASLTKMMSLYLVFEALEKGKIQLGTPVTISAHAASRGPTKMYFRAGQQVSVEILILAMAIKSANDASAAIAEHLAGSESAFAAQMTEKAREIGMQNSTFRNASGLPADGQVATARDFAILSRALLHRFPKYSEYFARRHFSYGERTYSNGNRLLHTNATVDGLKTGYTRAAGYNLASTAVQGDKRIIVVVMGARSSGERYRQTEHLMAAAWNASGIAVARNSENFEAANNRSFSLVSRATASTRVARTKTVRYASAKKSTKTRKLARAAYSKASFRRGKSASAVAIVYGREKAMAEMRLARSDESDN